MKKTTKSLVVILFGSTIQFLGCSAWSPEPDDAEATRAIGQTAEALEVSNMPADYVMTPNGFAHKSCVHALPSGAYVDDTQPGVTRAVKDGKELARYDACAYPSFRRKDQSESTKLQSSYLPALVGGWLRSIETSPTGSSIFFDELHENLTVPPIPASAYNGTTNQQLVYIFPSLQNNYRILQPVLEYGAGSANGAPATNWSVAAWLVDYTGAHWVSSSVNVLPGDLLWMAIDFFGFDASGNQKWQVQVQDWGTSGFTSMNYLQPSGGGYFYNRGEPLALEAYNVTACSQLPTSVTATSIYLDQDPGHADQGPSAVWSSVAGASTVCSTHATSDRASHTAPNTVTITVP